MARDVINWFEIPVTQFDRAKDFYERVFDVELDIMTLNAAKYGVWPNAQRGKNVNGAIVQGDKNNPSSAGTIVYFDVSGRMQEAIDRIKGNGGKVQVNRSPIGREMGYFAICMDTEGNRVGLYSSE